MGEEIVDEEAELSRKMGAEIWTNITISDCKPEEELVDLTSEYENGLVIMGTSIRPTSQRAFPGPTSECIIRNSVSAVAVISST